MRVRVEVESRRAPLAPPGAESERRPQGGPGGALSCPGSGGIGLVRGGVRSRGLGVWLCVCVLCLMLVGSGVVGVSWGDETIGDDPTASPGLVSPSPTATETGPVPTVTPSGTPTESPSASPSVAPSGSPGPTGVPASGGPGRPVPRPPVSGSVPVLTDGAVSTSGAGQIDGSWLGSGAVSWENVLEFGTNQAEADFWNTWREIVDGRDGLVSRWPFSIFQDWRNAWAQMGEGAGQVSQMKEYCDNLCIVVFPGTQCVKLTFPDAFLDLLVKLQGMWVALMWIFSFWFFVRNILGLTAPH